MDDIFRLLLGREAARTLATSSISAFAKWVATQHRSEPDPTLSEWLGLVALGPEAISEALIDSHERGRRLRSVVTFDRFVGPDVRDRARTQATSIDRKNRTDRLVTGTVNASNSESIAADDLARWIERQDMDEPKKRVAISAFFHDVPLGIQVAFLHEHRLREDDAVRLAKRIEQLGRTIPLASRERW